MSSSKEFIQKYFHIKSSANLDNIFSQMDNLSEIRRLQLDADFVGVYYAKDKTEDSIALSYALNQNHTYLNLNLMEKLSSADVSMFLSEFKDKAVLLSIDDLEGNLKSFAKKNNLNNALIFSYINEENHISTIVTFWKTREKINNEKTLKISEFISRMICKQMKIVSDVHQVSSYSTRLSELIQMFETPTGEYRFKDVVSSIIKKAQPLIQVSGVALFTKDIRTKKIRIQEFMSEEKVKPSFVKRLSRYVKEKFSDENNCKPGNEDWIDLSKQFESYYKSTVAIEFTPEKFYSFVLVLWTNNKDGFKGDDFDMLTIFSLFTKSILRNALVVRNVRRAKRIMEKSSSKMADIETTAALADMTSGVAHEFNNIIGGVVGRLQLIKRKLQDNALISELDRIESMVMEGAKTIKKIQEYTTGAKQKDLVSVDLGRILKEVLVIPKTKWKIIASEKNIDIVTNISARDAVIPGHSADLIDAINKVIENAVEFSPEGSEVEVALTTNYKQYKITVSDNGPGIPHNYKNRIFYPFFSTKSDRLAGLGLSVVHGIITRHGGNLKVYDNRPNGTVFEIIFVKPDKIREDSEITRKTKNSVLLNVLVVDDDLQIREVISDILTMHGHILTACPDGETALEALESQEFDLMITDLGMPGMSGMELAETVHKKRPEMPIAMITGWGTQLDKDQVRASGILTVLAKPFHLKDIKDLIDELV